MASPGTVGSLLPRISRLGASHVIVDEVRNNLMIRHDSTLRNGGFNHSKCWLNHPNMVISIDWSHSKWIEIVFLQKKVGWLAILNHHVYRFQGLSTLRRVFGFNREIMFGGWLFWGLSNIVGISSSMTSVNWITTLLTNPLMKEWCFGFWSWLLEPRNWRSRAWRRKQKLWFFAAAEGFFGWFQKITHLYRVYIYAYIIWLVVWNILYFPIYWE